MIRNFKQPWREIFWPVLWCATLYACVHWVFAIGVPVLVADINRNVRCLRSQIFQPSSMVTVKMADDDGLEVLWFNAVVSQLAHNAVLRLNSNLTELLGWTPYGKVSGRVAQWRLACVKEDGAFRVRDEKDPNGKLLGPLAIGERPEETHGNGAIWRLASHRRTNLDRPG